ncbi:hypothetical protein M0802_010503 [Mischocyttarus mexicanus]|nr:hypothetical protein M0802_010503 [Mischocyttarus mexicanus]
MGTSEPASAATAAAAAAPTSAFLSARMPDWTRRRGVAITETVEFEGTGDPSGDKSEVCRMTSLEIHRLILKQLSILGASVDIQ